MRTGIVAFAFLGCGGAPESQDQNSRYLKSRYDVTGQHGEKGGKLEPQVDHFTSTFRLYGGGQYYCLDKTNGTGNGTPITIWQCNGNGNQQWTFHFGGFVDNYYQIVNPTSGRCLDVPNGKINTPLQLFDCSWGNNANQLWSNSVADTYYQWYGQPYNIVYNYLGWTNLPNYELKYDVLSPECINVYGGNYSNGATVGTYGSETCGFIYAVPLFGVQLAVIGGDNEVWTWDGATW
jgi:hypothetical protein